ncbi:putative transmembrane protein [Heterostelium album PN500]|uniref:Putative transmembrane protein n=1 Tax=Heterostelium pallidum (strain ATCC 26659 / Pp 5 / PN500) TaxID=670386 RepID=D3B468_HETP5|nr:putative transmembrane protein [Heterostelium album PN500]EFA84116.1 putative transmembrane protein [Heterostelium album PN500]|eukprot:XP_020436233.1 putative transmembrane protein [Heterostelium album PN500]
MTTTTTTATESSNLISNEDYPFLRINRTFKVFTGIGMGVLFGCMINVLAKRPYLTRPHVHLTAAAALGVINYKTYDWQEDIYKKNFQILSRYENRLKRQEFIKNDLSTTLIT